MTDRQIINAALWAHRPTTAEGKAVLDLVALAERLLAGKDARVTDEQALRQSIDDLASPVLLWADCLEEAGEDQSVCQALRDLARKGKWPGTVAGLYRWSPERPEFGGGSSWTLPEDAVQTLARRSLDLGGKERGRFPTASAALLAAARVLAARLPPALARVCNCARPCRCHLDRCCKCSQPKCTPAEESPHV